MFNIAYQTFIDLLTNHSKATNSAFLQVYSALENAPDPYPLLEASVDSHAGVRGHPAETYGREPAPTGKYRQSDLAARGNESRLQSESANRQQLENNLESKVKEVGSSWSAVLEEKQDNWGGQGKGVWKRRLKARNG